MVKTPICLSSSCVILCPCCHAVLYFRSDKIAIRLRFLMKERWKFWGTSCVHTFYFLHAFTKCDTISIIFIVGQTQLSTQFLLIEKCKQQCPFSFLSFRNPQHGATPNETGLSVLQCKCRITIGGSREECLTSSHQEIDECTFIHYSRGSPSYRICYYDSVILCVLSSHGMAEKR